MERIPESKKEKVLEDDEIISLYFDRNVNAVSETDKKYGNYLYTVANNVLNIPEDTEECVNDTYVKTWNTIPPTVPRAFRAFLAKITRNLAIDRYNGEKKQISTGKGSADPFCDFEGFVPEDYSFEDTLRSRETVRIINGYLRSLDDRKLFIFVSRYYYAASVGSIAKKLGTTESAVYKMLTSMKAELRDRLTKGGIEV